MTPPRDPYRTWDAAPIFAAITIAVIMLPVADLADRVLR